VRKIDEEEIVAASGGFDEGNVRHIGCAAARKNLRQRYCARF